MSILDIIRSTIFKTKPLQSSQLSDEEKVNISAGKTLELVSLQAKGEHYFVKLKSREK